MEVMVKVPVDLFKALFDGWEGILKILIAAPIMYISVVVAIRIIGKRSTSQMNNFDWYRSTGCDWFADCFWYHSR